MKIVKQFRALKNIESISNAYHFYGQKFAASIFNDCVIIKDDEKLQEMLRKYVMTFVDAMQTFPPNVLPEWRAFLRVLIDDTINNAAFIYDKNGFPDWWDQSRRLIARARLTDRPDFATMRHLIMDGIDRLLNVASFASDCKNIVAVGKMLPNITRDIVETGGVVGNVVIWLNMVEIYTRQFQGRQLCQREQYVRLVAHLAKYKCASRDQLRLSNTKTVDRYSAAYAHAMFFLERVKHDDLHLAATFLCDNIATIAQFCYMYDECELSFSFKRSVKLATLLLKEEKEMTENKPRKLGNLMKAPKQQPIKSQIDELTANLKATEEEMHQLREAAAKLRKTIAKSKKLIADWEC